MSAEVNPARTGAPGLCKDKMQRKLCGVREKSANNAKVFFILLTGLLALAEAVT